jgi:hypothetical protein
MSIPDTIRLTGQHDIASAVPYLIGFHPQDSLVCVVLHRRAIVFVARLDLPAVANDPGWQAPADTVALIARYGSAALIVGYGARGRVDPAAATLDAALRAANVGVLATMRVHHGRYYCVDCDAGCPPEGRVYDPAASAFAAEAAYRGVAPLPDRAAVQQLIEPVRGAAGERMRTASLAALRRLKTMLPEATADQPGPDGLSVGTIEPVLRDGITAVQLAFAAAGRDETLSDDDVAWLAAVLLIPKVRDFAWTTCDGGETQRRLWIDVTRRPISATAAAPACLLALTAYLGGDGVLARIAVDRALQTDPGYSLAHLLDQALRAGVPPYVVRQAITGTVTG